MATGGGFATRTLYEDSAETIFDAQRPVILNGIGQIATRGDLVDRAIALELPRVTKRVTERELWARFEAARPAALGALLDGVAHGLGHLGGVELDDIPRMADFAEWVVAAGPGAGLDVHAFMEAYSENRARGSEAVVESDPITRPLLEIADAGFEGPASALLKRIGEVCTEAETRQEGWPRSPDALGKALARLAPDLRTQGYEVERAKSWARRWQIRKAADPSVPSVPSHTQGELFAEPEGRLDTSDTSAGGSSSGTDTPEPERRPVRLDAVPEDEVEEGLA